MKPYPPGKPIEEVQRELGLTSVVKLASNENPLGPSPLAIEAIKAAANSVNIYPDASAWKLKQQLATKFGVSLDQVMIGAGSDEIIGVLGSIFLEEGSELLMGDPSFMRYDSAAHLNNAKLVKVPLNSEWRYDLTAIRASVSGDTRLVFIANPNNPTGTTVTKTELESFLDSLPSHVTVVLDEAYYEFAAFDPEIPDGIELVKAGRPVISLRTFSKAYGLAGLRVGYGFADASIVKAFDAARPPFDVNSLAQAGASAALEDQAHLRRGVEQNARVKSELVEKMRSLGFETIPSHANFVCVNVRQPSMPVFEALMRKGVIVRPGEALGMPNFLRVSVGTELETKKFIDAFESVMLAAPTV